MSKKELWGKFGQVYKKFAFSDNSEQNNWNKIEGLSKIKKGKKSLISTVGCF